MAYLGLVPSEHASVQMEQSMRRLQTSRIDLMQVHNLLDWRTQLATNDRCTLEAALGATSDRTAGRSTPRLQRRTGFGHKQSSHGGIGTSAIHVCHFRDAQYGLSPLFVYTAHHPPVLSTQNAYARRLNRSR
jgi:hypothetical protein